MPSELRKRRGCKYWIKLLSVGLFGGVLLAYLGYLVISVEAMIQPARASICCETPGDLGLKYETITLTADDGVTLAGWYIPSRNAAAVILLHGYGANRTEMLGRAEILARHGYGVLLYDERASGESGGDLRTYGWLDVQDVPVALKYVRGRADVNPARVGILGFSIGGQIAIRAAAHSDQIKSVIAEEPGFPRITDSPYLPDLCDEGIWVGYWIGERILTLRTGVPMPAGVLDELPLIAPRPILFIATGQDYGRLLIQHFYEQASEPKAYWEVPETYHGGSPSARPEEYEQTIVSFFDRTLSPEN